MELTKIPPSDIEAEQAVLGSMLTDKDAVISAIEVLKPEDFYREDNKAIYEAYGAENIIAVHIRHIREKIEINPREPKYLKVIWGIGYKMEKI